MIKALVLSILIVAATAFAPISPRLSKSAALNSIAVGESFPSDALKKWGVAGKPAVIYFYGADGSPSCTKEAAAFDAAAGDFKALGCTVVGVRNEKGVKEGFSDEYSQKFVVDAGDSVRNAIGIPKDFFVLGGRETYVVDSTGTVATVFNDQFKAEEHASRALAAAAALPPKKAAGFSFPKLF